MNDQISINIGGTEYELPDPGVISESTLRATAIREDGGSVLFYDYQSESGGIYVPGMGDRPFWMIYKPIDVAEFMRCASELISIVRHTKKHTLN